MPNDDPENPAEEQGQPAGSEPAESKPHRRAGLTREQRQFLNKPRATPPAKPEDPAAAGKGIQEPPSEEKEEIPGSKQRPGGTARDKATPAAPAPVAPRTKGARIFELQQAALIIGAILLLALVFYFGRNYERLKYMILTRVKQPVDKLPDNYPGVSASDLVEQALAAERSGDWQEAVKRLLAAKQKDLRYRGLFFRMGKLFYIHGDYKSADKAFERAIVFQEDVAQSNQYRGLIATHDNDYTAAQHFFEEAARADPLVADYYYFWGEALRLGLQPQPAIARYEEARLRAPNEQDARVCDFKIRLAEMEAADSPKVENEVAKKAAEGPLPVDWLMTAAALKLREGKIDEAVRFIDQARDGKWPGLFASCASDMAFKDAIRKHPELELPLHLDVPQHATIR